MATIIIEIGIAGLTNVKALPYSADFARVWDGVALALVDSATPLFIDMSEILVNSVGTGIYKASLPSALEYTNTEGGLWISIYNAGDPPAVSDPLHGYIVPSYSSALIGAAVDAISKLEINIDPAELRKALEGAEIRPTELIFGPCADRTTTRMVVGPCPQQPVRPLGFNL